MKSVIFLILLLQVAYGFNLCSYHNTDLCIGVSGVAEVGQQLQLKSRFNNLNATIKIDWALVNETFVKFSGNETLYLDKAATTTRAVLSRQTSGLVLNQTVKLNGTDLCLTLMKCDVGPGGFCNPASIREVLSVPDIKKGSYLRFRECKSSSLAVSQHFEIDPPCARNCTQAMLNNTKCDLECYTKECYYDGGYCNSTAPSLAPTTQPTTEPPTIIATNAPSRAPSTFTTGYVSASPTPSPLLTDSPTHNPNIHPISPPTPKPSTLSPSSESPPAPPQTPTPTGTNGTLPANALDEPWSERDISLLVLLLLCICALCGLSIALIMIRIEEGKKPTLAPPPPPPPPPPPLPQLIIQPQTDNRQAFRYPGRLNADLDEVPL